MQRTYISYVLHLVEMARVELASKQCPTNQRLQLSLPEYHQTWTDTISDGLTVEFSSDGSSRSVSLSSLRHQSELEESELIQRGC